MKLSTVIKNYKVKVEGFKTLTEVEKYSNQNASKEILLTSKPIHVLSSMGITDFHALVIPKDAVYETFNDLLKADPFVNHYRINQASNTIAANEHIIIAIRDKQTAEKLQAQYLNSTILSGEIKEDNIKDKTVIGSLPAHLITKCRRYRAVTIKTKENGKEILDLSNFINLVKVEEKKEIAISSKAISLRDKPFVTSIVVKYTDIDITEKYEFRWNVSEDALNTYGRKNKILQKIPFGVNCDSYMEYLQKISETWYHLKDAAVTMAYMPIPIESNLFQEMYLHKFLKETDGPFKFVDTSNLLDGIGYNTSMEGFMKTIKIEDYKSIISNSLYNALKENEANELYKYDTTHGSILTIAVYDILKHQIGDLVTAPSKIKEPVKTKEEKAENIIDSVKDPHKEIADNVIKQIKNSFKLY